MPDLPHGDAVTGIDLAPSVFNRVHTSRAVAPAAAEGPLEASDPARAPFLVPVSSGFSFVRQLPAQTRGRPRPGRPGYQNLLEAPRPPPEDVPRPAGPHLLSLRDSFFCHARFRHRFGRFAPSCGRTRLALHQVSQSSCLGRYLSDAIPLACLIARSISSRYAAIIISLICFSIIFVTKNQKGGSPTFESHPAAFTHRVVQSCRP